MRLLFLVLLAIGVSLAAGCDGNGSAQGGGTDKGSHGRLKIGLPF
jgi:hypothetical protein